jgi:ubiquinone/menaquinone biosynthesis C-methylase UbiE
MELGNFTGLAENYSAYRPAYSASILKAIIALLDKDFTQCNIADIGAGTGIWTRMLSSLNPNKIIAIEPNEDMRNVGIRDSAVNTNITWQKGSGENTGLEDNSVDMVSMATSFHWVNFELGCQETHRILKEKGRFVALWNPWQIEENPLTEQIKEYLNFLKPDLKTTYSGKGSITYNLTEKLYESKLFEDVVYLEAKYKTQISIKHYIGILRSINDIQTQLGTEKFELFVSFIEKILVNQESLEITYLTKAWSALKRR